MQGIRLDLGAQTQRTYDGAGTRTRGAASCQAGEVQLIVEYLRPPRGAASGRAPRAADTRQWAGRAPAGPGVVASRAAPAPPPRPPMPNQALPWRQSPLSQP